MSPPAPIRRQLEDSSQSSVDASYEVVTSDPVAAAVCIIVYTDPEARFFTCIEIFAGLDQDQLGSATINDSHVWFETKTDRVS